MQMYGSGALVGRRYSADKAKNTLPIAYSCPNQYWWWPWRRFYSQQTVKRLQNIFVFFTEKKVWRPTRFKALCQKSIVFNMPWHWIHKHNVEQNLVTLKLCVDFYLHPHWEQVSLINGFRVVSPSNSSPSNTYVSNIQSLRKTKVNCTKYDLGKEL